MCPISKMEPSDGKKCCKDNNTPLTSNSCDKHNITSSSFYDI